MKKLLLVVLALLLFAGVSYATNVPRANDPVNGKEVWITPVHNYGDLTAAVGDCVEWSMDDSSGNDKNYIVQCDSTDTFLVAGIVFGQDILTKADGVIAIKGPVPGNIGLSGENITAGALLCSSVTVNGYMSVCSDTGTDANAVGYATAAATASSATVNVFLH